MNARTLTTAASIAALALASYANADTFTLKGMVYNPALTGNVTYNSSTGDAYIGQLSFQDSHGNMYQTYCDDLSHDISVGGQYGYNIAQVSDSMSLALGNIIAGSQSSVNSPLSSAAVQLAVWSYEYNGSASPDLQGSTFAAKMNGLSSSDQATLNSLVATDFSFASHYQGENVFEMQRTGGGQNQLFVQSAPEPMSLGALAVGMIGLVSRRRRKTA